MAMRVEWLNESHTILCLSVRDGLNWQEAHRLLNEWVRPMIANAGKSIALVADLSESKIFKADADLLVRRMFQFLCDSVHTEALAVVGVDTKYPEFGIISANSCDEAVEELTIRLAKHSLA